LVNKDGSTSSGSESRLTAQQLKNHNISLSNKRKYGEQGIQEANEDDEDEHDRKKQMVIIKSSILKNKN
jgi:hypothetical protein